MHRSILVTAVLGVTLLPVAPSEARDLILAQSSGTNLGSPRTQPLPGGGVDAGPGAPTATLPGVPPGPRGAPEPGAATPSPGGAATSGSNLAPTGAIRPGSGTAGEGTGGN